MLRVQLILEDLVVVVDATILELMVPLEVPMAALEEHLELPVIYLFLMLQEVREIQVVVVLELSQDLQVQVEI